MKEKQMKKGLALIIIAVLLVTFFCACGSAETSTGSSSYAKLLPGTWRSGTSWYTFYDDGTYEDEDYDYGTWSVVNGELLKLEQETYPEKVYTHRIVSLNAKELCLAMYEDSDRERTFTKDN